METTLTDPIVNYVFGALYLILFGFVVQGLRVWRTDSKENSKALADTSQACSEALAKNAVANTKLSISLDGMTRANRKLHEELCRRPCIIDEGTGG